MIVYGIQSCCPIRRSGEPQPMEAETAVTAERFVVVDNRHHALTVSSTYSEGQVHLER